MKYSKYFGASGGILFRLGHFLKSIKKDFKATQKIVVESEFDLIISDNRYGVYAEEVESILLTHQLNFNIPFSSILELPLQNLLEKFNAIWVPDNERRTYSGILGKPERALKVPVEYIGALSRFSKKESLIKDIKFTLIASGPEPFRSQLIDYFYKNFSLIKEQCCIVGNIEEDKYSKSENILLKQTLNSDELEKLIDRTEIILCRSGYSSIMDLIQKQQKAVLIPTPSQAEQEYLAKYHSSNPLFESVLKKDDLPKIMRRLF